VKIRNLIAAAALALSSIAIPHTAQASVVKAGTGINLDGTTFKQAARAYSCTNGFICFYDGTNGSGAAYAIAASWTGCRSMPSWFDNRTSSIYNNTGYNWHVWQISNSGCNEAGSAWSNITPRSTGNMSSYWNNVITQYERN
jgi:hypothetical protein